MAALAITLVPLVLIGMGILLVLRRIAMPATVAQCDPSWVDEFSVAKYRPMLRLLSGDDYEFLKNQPGYSPKMLRKLRAQRRDIFRGYLRSLVRDFHKLHMAARVAMLYGQVDRPDLAAALVRQKMLFIGAVLAVEARLLLHAAGIGTVDVRALIGSLESMHSSVSQFATAQSAAM